MGNKYSVLKKSGSDDDGIISVKVGNNEVLKIDCTDAHLSVKSDHIQTNEDFEEILKKHKEPKNVKYFKLEGTPVSLLPIRIHQFINLRVLSLRENQLVELPCSIIYLKQLEKLDLTSNFLNSIPTSIRYLLSLKELLLRSNRLTFLPTEILHLTKLKVLDATGNPIKSPPEGIVQGGLQDILVYLQQVRSARRNLFRFKPWISDRQGRPRICVPPLAQICVDCAINYDIDFLNSSCIPPRVKALIHEIKNEQQISELGEMAILESYE